MYSCHLFTGLQLLDLKGVLENANGNAAHDPDAIVQHAPFMYTMPKLS